MEDKFGAYILHLDACNQKCLFCMKSDDIQKKLKLDYKSVAKKIMIAKRNGFQKIDFFGGEPTIFPFLKDAILLAQKNGMISTLATNCLKFSSNRYTKTFFSGIDIGNISIRTSLHSHKEKIHDHITQVSGSHQHTVAGIKNILKKTKRLCTTVVITSLNYHDLSEIVTFIYSMGSVAVKFSGLSLTGRMKKNINLFVDEQKYATHLFEAITLAKKYGFFYIGIENMPKSFMGTVRKKYDFVERINN